MTDTKPNTPRASKTPIDKASTSKSRRMAREPKAPAGDTGDTPPSPATTDPVVPTPAVAELATGSARRPSKLAIVLDLLRRADGASLDELVDATGWLPHSTRAALTGLRKKGHAIERTKIDARTSYRIAGGEA